MSDKRDRWLLESLIDHQGLPNIEEKLQELEQKYKSLLQHSRQGIILIKDHPPFMVWANAVMADLLGHRFEPIKSTPLKTIEPLLQPKGYKLFFSHYQDCLSGKPVPLKQPVQALKKDSSVIWLEYSLVQVKHLGQPAVLSLFLDITDRERLEITIQNIQLEYERQIQANDSELKVYIEELKLQKEELSRVSRELWETNNALTVLARNIDKTRQEAELRVAQTIRGKVLPLINHLKKEQMMERYRLDLDILISHLEDLSAAEEKQLKISTALSPTELKVASLIKNGLSNQKISAELYISIDTVKSHRRNIRKKLHIQNKKTNLCSFLKT